MKAWLESAGYGEIAYLVRPAKSGERYSEAVLRALDRRALIDEQFFMRLAERLPDQQAELARMAADMGVALAHVPDPLDAGEAVDYPSLHLAAGSDTAPGDDAIGDTTVIEDPGLALAELLAVARATESVVQVLGADGFPMATGVVIGDDLLLVPDYVAGASPASARTEAIDGQRRTSDVTGVVASDSSLGVAVCRLAEPLGPTIEITDRRPAAGNRLTLVHFPMGGSMRVNAAVVRGTTAQSISFNATSAPGSGGGALVDGAGRLVGLNHSRSSATCIAVSASNCLDLLRAHAELNAILATVTDPASITNVDPALEAVFDTDAPASEQQPVLVQVSSGHVDLSELTGVEVSSALGNTVAARVTAEGLEALKQLPEVIAIDLSRNVGTRELYNSIPAIGCAVPHQVGERGEECLIALIDNGIDVRHDAFVANGSTKIEVYWDQTAPDSPCSGASPEAQQLAGDLSLTSGRLYLRADIDAIRGGANDTLPPAAECAHGTAVAAIAAGTSCPPGVQQFPGGVAPASRMIVVRFDRDRVANGYEVSHIDALAFIDAIATRHDRPVVVNISNGVNAGGHDGFDNVERACESFCDKPGRAVVKSAGNERTEGRHTDLRVASNMADACGIEVDDAPGSDLVEFWWPAKNEYKVVVTAPNGQQSGEISPDFPDLDETLMGTRVLAGLKPRIDRNGKLRARLRVELLPVGDGRVAPGQWKLSFVGMQVRVAEGRIHGWIEIAGRKTKFQTPTNTSTVTVPGTSRRVICVGAIAAGKPITTYDFSSEGPSAVGDEKPDLVAPGIDIQSAAAGSTTAVGAKERGTSFAAPHVTGAIALGLSAAFKRDPAKIPTATEVIGALHDHTSEEFDVWDERLGYGPLDVPAFLTLLEETVAERE